MTITSEQSVEDLISKVIYWSDVPSIADIAHEKIREFAKQAIDRVNKLMFISEFIASIAIKRLERIQNHEQNHFANMKLMANKSNISVSYENRSELLQEYRKTDGSLRSAVKIVLNRVFEFTETEVPKDEIQWKAAITNMKHYLSDDPLVLSVVHNVEETDPDRMGKSQLLQASEIMRRVSAAPVFIQNIRDRK